jgi:hypothetical protein
MSQKLTEEDIKRAAESLGVSVAVVKAVSEVESRGVGFHSDGRPVILFERHIMRRLLRQAGVDTASLEMKQPGLVNAKAGGYEGGAAEHDRLGMAAKIDRDAALQSCSWGAYQIMGFHWQTLGFSSLQALVNAMYRGAGDQLDAFVRFVKTSPAMVKALKTQDWRTFARLYNGPAFEKNKYDTKLAAAFAKHSSKPV